MAGRKAADKIPFRCMSCGKSGTEADFYTSPYSPLWQQTGQKVLFCKSCIEKMHRVESELYGSDTALMLTLARLDLPYVKSLYIALVDKYGACNLGTYIRSLNGIQYKNKTWSTSLIEGELGRSENDVRECNESKWKRSDKNNMYAVISMVGYDPFADLGLNENERKYCFNVMAGYCAIPGIDEDGHRLESAIQITLCRLQSQQLDNMIFKETSMKNPNVKTIDTLSTSKKGLLATINSIAKDNNLSSAYNGGNVAGQNTLTKKMKEMARDDFKEVQVNVFDIKTCEAMQQIADLSNQSILEQLKFESSDYMEMLKDQREMLNAVIAERDKLQEENRNLKNEIMDRGAE